MVHDADAAIPEMRNWVGHALLDAVVNVVVDDVDDNGDGNE